MGQKVFQFKIVLEEIKPLIWRRIQIADSCTFWNLHEAIQNSFPWTNSHLHCFEVLDPRFNETEYFGFEDEELGHRDGSKVKVKDYISLSNKKMRYEYDFGDSWQHLITLEKIVDKESGKKYPICLGGANACPPEDVGGVCGYEHFLEVIANPKDPEHEAFMTWGGRSFIPNYFDLKNVHFRRLSKGTDWI
jgi:hypothetical protein